MTPCLEQKLCKKPHSQEGAELPRAKRRPPKGQEFRCFLRCNVCHRVQMLEGSGLRVGLGFRD